MTAAWEILSAYFYVGDALAPSLQLRPFGRIVWRQGPKRWPWRKTWPGFGKPPARRDTFPVVNFYQRSPLCGPLKRWIVFLLETVSVVVLRGCVVVILNRSTLKGT